MRSGADLCACGEPLHYATEQSRRFMDRLVAEHGPFVKIAIHGTVPRAFMVPRHFIALHGVKGSEIPALAARHGWEEVDP